ncbi:MAG: rhodanese-like domain-containing protein [Verrucomicrobiota bacterium]
MKTLKMFSWLTTLMGALSGCSAADSAAIKRAGPDEFAQLMAGDKVVVLDVRTPGEFKGGHVKGAVNVDYLGTEFESKATALDKTKTYLVYCAAGVRSAKACNKLVKLGFGSLVDLKGGYGAWQGAGKPVE